MSFLPLHAWSHDTYSQSQCKLHSDDCLSIVPHKPQGTGCPFTIRVAFGCPFTTQLSFVRTGSALSVPCSFAFGKIQTSDLPCQTA